MRALLIVAPLALASCLATQGALERVSTATANLNAALADQSSTVEQLEARGNELKAEVAALPAAIARDKDDALTLGEGLLGGGGLAGILLAAGKMALASRDKRKLLGQDPLEARIKMLEAKS